MEEQVKEAEVKEEIEIVKPQFDGEIDAKIVTLGEIENNMDKVKEYAIKINEYFDKIHFSEEQVKEAKDQRADINKKIKIISSFRKDIVEKFKEPIKQFEDTAKEAEKILTKTSENITDKISVYEKKQLDEIESKCRNYFDEYAISKNVDIVKFEDLGMKIIGGLLTEKGELKKKTIEEITTFIDRIHDDLNRISSLEYSDEILIEYKKNLNCADAIALVFDRKRQYEEMQKQKEQKKEEKLTDEKMLNKIETLIAPKVEKTEELVTATFKATCLKNKMIKLVNFMKEEGITYEQYK